MTFAILSLLYGVVAGVFLPVAGFAVGLAALTLVAGLILAATETGWGIVSTVLAVIGFAQIGYFTSAFYMASTLAGKRADGARGAVDTRPVRRKPAGLAERPSTED